MKHQHGNANIFAAKATSLHHQRRSCRRHVKSREASGFTLIELIVTIAITAIMSVTAVPSFIDLMRNNRSATQANEFLAALNLARSEAAKSGQNVSLCSSTDAASCRTSDPTNWSDGWILFVNGTDPLQVLRVWPGITNGVASFKGGAGVVTFRGTGQAASAVNFDYQPTACDGKQARAINVASVGRAWVQEADCD